MALGLGIPCASCGCSPPCSNCTATCTQPHTGGAFGTVYTRYFGGAEAGNPTDGYLTATGDSDTSDPYDGMDGTGPWYQRVSGGFTLGGSSPGTRFPCSVRVSFWRNTYTLGASTIPPPGSTLTENTIEVIVTSGALVAPDGRVITAADGAVAVSSVPLVSGGGDASGSDPRSGDGTVSFSAQCWNVETIFTIRATIRWNVKKRQHVVYGKVRECYDVPDPDHPTVTSCDTFCSGTPSPNQVYLTISGLSTATEVSPSSGSSSSPSLSFMNATYIVGEYMKSSGICDSFLSGYSSGSVDSGLQLLSAVNVPTQGYGWYAAIPQGNTWVTGFIKSGGLGYNVVIICQKDRSVVCSSTSGTATVSVQEVPVTSSSKYFSGSCSWTLSP